MTMTFTPSTSTPFASSPSSQSHRSFEPANHLADDLARHLRDCQPASDYSSRTMFAIQRLCAHAASRPITTLLCSGVLSTLGMALVL